jgi:ethanolamine ammonia-lyase large subunit
MKYTTILIIALIACVTAQKPGKREDIEANLRGIWDSLSNLVQQVLLPPVTGAIQTTAELLAQITAGVAIGGLDALTGLFGKREIQDNLKGFLDSLTNLVQQVLLPPVTGAIQTTAELLAQITAGVAIGGLDALTGLFGKREIQDNLKGFLDSLTNLVQQVLLPPVTGAIQTTAELLAQITAGVAIGGLDALNGLFGKRATTSDLLLTHAICLSDISACFNNIITPAGN